MNNYKGVLIEESLENKDILKKVKIISTKVEQVTDEHKTPWLLQWTLCDIEIPETDAQKISEEISKSLDRTHGGSWYADFKNDTYHYIIFHNKVFKVNRNKKDQYDDVVKFGLSLGIPDHQLDFSPHIKEWER